MLKTIKVPTLVLHGEDDPLLPVECGRDVARLVPGAEIQTYPGWGHDFPGAADPDAGRAHRRRSARANEVAVETTRLSSRA